MSYWNYRVIKEEFPEHNEDSYQIHEVYYDDDGKIEGWTQSPVAPCGYTFEELREDIRYQLIAFRKPILKMNEAGNKLRPDEIKPAINEGHYFDALNRVSIAQDYIYQFVGSHPVIKKHKKVKELYDQVAEKLGELYQELDKLEFDPKVE